MASILFLLPVDHQFFLYTTLFSILLLSGFGVPIPEEVTLIIGGYLAYLEFIDLRSAIYVLAGGIIAADIVGYALGRFCGEWLWRNIFSRIRGMDRVIAHARAYFDRHGEKTVIFSRVFAAVRVAVPIFAGHFRMNFKKFVAYDIIGAIPWTVALVSLSYYLASELDIVTEVRAIKRLVFILIILGIVLYAVIRFIHEAYKELHETKT